MSKLYINTTQNVPLFFTPASVGERVLGYAIDILIKIAYVITMYYVLFFTGVLTLISAWDMWSAGAFFLLLYAPVAFYSLVCESMMEGRTFGKKLMKIKVVKIDGFQASFPDYVTRWLFRLIDIDMGFVPGLLSMLFTKHSQRLGDLAAGTAVITEKSKYNISHTILMDVSDGYVPAFSQSQILRFNDNDMRIIKDHLTEASKTRDAELLKKLALKVQHVMELSDSYPNPHDFIVKVMQDYTHYTGR